MAASHAVVPDVDRHDAELQPQTASQAATVENRLPACSVSGQIQMTKRVILIAWFEESCSRVREHAKSMQSVACLMYSLTYSAIGCNVDREAHCTVLCVRGGSQTLQTSSFDIATAWRDQCVMALSDRMYSLCGGRCTSAGTAWPCPLRRIRKRYCTCYGTVQYCTVFAFCGFAPVLCNTVLICHSLLANCSNF